MKPFKKLSIQENEALLRFPVYISILASNNDGILDEAEKKAAIGLAHLKTFSCNPLLKDFYLEAEKVFENNLERLDKELPEEKGTREETIKKELSDLEMILLKLGKKYTSAMHNSMKSFKEHVLKASHSVIVDFILPLPIPGLTES
jgi:hypothetical protein